MAAAGKFAPPDEAEVARLLLGHPFAWVVTSHEDGPCATPLPLRPVLDGSGGFTELLGHFARGNPHADLVRRAPRALVLFMGPHGYVSASWFTDRTRTPTWNYAAAQFLVDIELVEDEAGTAHVLRDLVGAMEQGRLRAWSIEEMGPRYSQLARGIVAFRARIVERRVKFKLGQDERDAEYADIVGALGGGAGGRSGDDLLEWMQRCNRSRGG